MSSTKSTCMQLFYKNTNAHLFAEPPPTIINFYPETRNWSIMVVCFAILMHEWKENKILLLVITGMAGVKCCGTSGKYFSGINKAWGHTALTVYRPQGAGNSVAPWHTCLNRKPILIDFTGSKREREWVRERESVCRTKRDFWVFIDIWPSSGQARNNS